MSGPHAASGPNRDLLSGPDPGVPSGPDPDAHARLLCDWCLEARPGDQVVIAMPLRAVPLARGLYRALLERGAWPLVRVAASEFASEFYRAATESQLDSIAPLELTESEQADCFVGIEAPGNTRALAGVDPALITRATRASLAARTARLASRWCRTLWPTPALAQQAAMGDDEYAAFVAGALLLDRPDPIAAWQALSERQESLVQRLQQAHEIRIQSEATDLRLTVTGRTWINSDGRHNMPSGEVFTGPHETSANGTITFDVPSGARGVEVAGVELTFRGGEVVAARADSGDAYLQQALQTDAGARFLGELGIGTNEGIQRATGLILLDEKMAGTVHLALGRSYPETGGRNGSALHWDLICDLRDGGQLSADGEPLLEDGALVA